MNDAYCLLLEDIHTMYITYGPENQFLKTRISLSQDTLHQLASADIFNPVKLSIVLGEWKNGAFQVLDLQIDPFQRHIYDRQRLFKTMNVE